jgi:hypothetical protein
MRALLCALALALAVFNAPAHADEEGFSFAVIGHAFRKSSDEASLSRAIAETDEDNLAFVVVNGIKSPLEPCSDDVYERRRSLLAKAKNGLVLSLAASDWAECRRGNGRSAAIERLTRVRDLFFDEDISFGSARIPLTRESASIKFRSYAENARWEVGGIQFATLNLPANNNHYLLEAGRNSEFEDRLIANRYWLQRIFHGAARQKMAGIVIFCDANPMSLPQGVRRDGYLEVRRQLQTLASHYPGRVLLVHGRNEPGAGAIGWSGNVGVLGIGAGWAKIDVNTAAAPVFRLAARMPAQTGTHSNR